MMAAALDGAGGVPPAPDSFGAMYKIVKLQARGLKHMKKQEYRLAILHFTECYRGRVSLQGKNHRDTLHVLTDLGRCCMAENLNKEGEEYLREAVVGWKSIAGDADIMTLTAQKYLLDMLLDQGKKADACELHRWYEHAVRLLRTASIREMDPEVLSLLHCAGARFRAAGLFSEATPLLRFAVECRRVVLGPQDKGTLESVLNLGTCLADLSQYEEAEQVFQEYTAAIDEVPRVYLEFSDYLECRRLLVSVLLPQGKLDAARRVIGEFEVKLEVFREEERRMREHSFTSSELVEEQRNVCSSVHNMGVLLCAHDMFVEAAPILRIALDSRKERPFWLLSQDAAASRQALGVCLTKLRRFADAEICLREDLEANVAAHGYEHVDTLSSYEALSANLMQQGKQIPPLTDSALPARAGGLLSPSTAEVPSQQRQTLLMSRADATPAAVAVPRTEAAILADSVERAVDLYKAGQMDEASGIFTQAMSDYERVLGPEHPETLALTELVCQLAGQSIPVEQHSDGASHRQASQDDCPVSTRACNPLEVPATTSATVHTERSNLANAGEYATHSGNGEEDAQVLPVPFFTTVSSTAEPSMTAGLAGMAGGSASPGPGVARDANTAGLDTAQDSETAAGNIARGSAAAGPLPASTGNVTADGVLCAELPSPGTVSSLRARLELIAVLLHQGKVAEACDVQLDVLETIRMHDVTKFEPDVLTAMHMAGVQLYAAKQLSEAGMLLLSTVEGRAAVLPRHHEHTLQTEYALASCLLEQGRLEEAEHVSNAYWEGINGKPESSCDPADVLKSYLLRARVLRSQGKPELPQTLDGFCAKVVDFRLRVPLHPTALTVVHDMATELFNHKMFADAVPLLEIVVDCRKSKRLRLPFDLQQQQQGIASVMHATPVLSASGAGSAGVGAPSVSQCTHHQCEALCRQGQVEEAGKLIMRNRICNHLFPGDVAATSQCLESIFRLAAKMFTHRRYAEAAALCDATVQGSVIVSGPDHRMTLIFKAMLVQCLFYTDRSSEAKRCLDQVMSDYMRLLGSEHVDTQEFILLVCRFLSGHPTAKMVLYRSDDTDAQHHEVTSPEKHQHRLAQTVQYGQTRLCNLCRIHILNGTSARCTECDYDECMDCFAQTDSVLISSGHHYCGKKLEQGQRSYHHAGAAGCTCGGVCGPMKGCNCSSCHALDEAAGLGAVQCFVVRAEALCIHYECEALYEQGQFDEADLLLREKRACDQLSTRDASVTSRCLDSIDRLAAKVFDRERYDEARLLYRAAIGVATSSAGPKCSAALAFKVKLGKCFYRSGKRSEAKGIFEGTLRDYQSELGSDHPDTIELDDLLRALDWRTGDMPVSRLAGPDPTRGDRSSSERNKGTHAKRAVKRRGLTAATESVGAVPSPDAVMPTSVATGTAPDATPTTGPPTPAAGAAHTSSHPAGLQNTRGHSHRARVIKSAFTGEHRSAQDVNREWLAEREVVLGQKIAGSEVKWVDLHGFAATAGKIGGHLADFFDGTFAPGMPNDAVFQVCVSSQGALGSGSDQTVVRLGQYIGDHGAVSDLEHGNLVAIKIVPITSPQKKSAAMKEVALHVQAQRSAAALNQPSPFVKLHAALWCELQCEYIPISASGLRAIPCVCLVLELCAGTLVTRVQSAVGAAAAQPTPSLDKASKYEIDERERYYITEALLCAVHALHCPEQPVHMSSVAYPAIIHCDIRPENVFFGRSGRVMLGDFGMARHVSDPDDRTPDIDVNATAVDSAQQPTFSTILGGHASGLMSAHTHAALTRLHLPAPEVIDATERSHAGVRTFGTHTDVWACGQVLFYLFSEGCYPFVNEESILPDYAQSIVSTADKNALLHFLMNNAHKSALALKTPTDTVEGTGTEQAGHATVQQHQPYFQYLPADTPPAMLALLQWMLRRDPLKRLPIRAAMKHPALWNTAASMKVILELNASTEPALSTDDEDRVRKRAQAGGQHGAETSISGTARSLQVLWAHASKSSQVTVPSLRHFKDAGRKIKIKSSVQFDAQGSYQTLASRFGGEPPSRMSNAEFIRSDRGKHSWVAEVFTSAPQGELSLLHVALGWEAKQRREELAKTRAEQTDTCVAESAAQSTCDASAISYPSWLFTCKGLLRMLRNLASHVMEYQHRDKSVMWQHPYTGTYTRERAEALIRHPAVAWLLPELWRLMYCNAAWCTAQGVDLQLLDVPVPVQAVATGRSGIGPVSALVSGSSVSAGLLSSRAHNRAEPGLAASQALQGRVLSSAGSVGQHHRRASESGSAASTLSAEAVSEDSLPFSGFTSKSSVLSDDLSVDFTWNDSNSMMPEYTGRYVYVMSTSLASVELFMKLEAADLRVRLPCRGDPSEHALALQRAVAVIVPSSAADVEGPISIAHEQQVQKHMSSCPERVFECQWPCTDEQFERIVADIRRLPERIMLEPAAEGAADGGAGTTPNGELESGGFFSQIISHMSQWLW